MTRGEERRARTLRFQALHTAISADERREGKVKRTKEMYRFSLVKCFYAHQKARVAEGSVAEAAGDELRCWANGGPARRLVRTDAPIHSGLREVQPSKALKH